jgi:hypothetical protein
MDLHLEAFALGFKDRLAEKSASSNFLDHMANENILPSFSGQKHWKYVRTPEGIRFTDGDKVYGFGLKDFTGETQRIPKLDDIPYLGWEKDKTEGGTLQVHRSSPDSIYMTLANGRENPTFVMEHEEGKNWKYLPSKKMIKRLESLKAPKEEVIPGVNPESLLEGAEQTMKTANFSEGTGLFGSAQGANEALWKAINGGKGLLQSMGSHPLLTIGGVTLGGMLLNQLRKKHNPGYARETAQSPGKDWNNGVAIPLLGGAALAGLGAAVK